MMLILFLFYYTKLLIGIALGFHETANPINIKWRWNFWQHKYKWRRK